MSEGAPNPLPNVTRTGVVLRIRAATVDDIPRVAGHRVAMFRDMGKLAYADAPALVRGSVDFLGRAIPSGEYRGWLAELADRPGHVVGGAGVQLRQAMPRPPIHGLPATGDAPEALVINVYVEPAWRGRGVAEQMMRALLAWCYALPVARVVLHASDAGRALYERLGFVQTNEMRHQPDRMPAVAPNESHSP